MYIEYFMQKGTTLIIEGAHLDPSFNVKMLQQYGNQCICFAVSVQDELEFIKRFQLRNKEMTINPHNNEDVKKYLNITEIQYRIINLTR